MFNRLVFAFYWADSIENCGVFFFVYPRIEIELLRFFCIFLWCYQLIMIRKHGAVSCLAMKQMNRTVQFRQ